MIPYRGLWSDIVFSEKVNALSDRAFRLWAHVLVSTDALGRFPADALQLAKRCVPLLHWRLVQVDSALLELSRVKSARGGDEGLIHLYDAADGHRYLVLHDREQWKTGNLNAKSKFPDPPFGLCRCLSKPSKGAGPPSHSPSQERERPAENDPATETLRARVARAYQTVNGGTADLEKLAAHFVQLEHASLAADADWLVQRAGAGDMLGRKPWEAAERLRIAWTEERARRATEAEAAKRAAAAPPAEDLTDPKVRSRAVQARAQAVRKGAIPIGAVEADLRDEVRHLVQEGA